MKILLALIILSAQGFSMTRGDIRDKIRDMVLDSNSSTSKQHWSSTTINDYIDLAIQEISRISWCMKNSYTFTISTTIGRSIYALQDDIAQIERVTIHEDDTVANVSYKEECVALKETSMISLDDGDWETKFSTYSYGAHDKPTQYYTYQSTATYLNIGFDPPADKEYTITVYYDEISEDLSLDASIPFRGIKQLVPYHDLICLRVASMFCVQDNNIQKARFYFTLYEAMLKDGTKSLNWKSNFSPNMSGSWE